MKKLLFFTMLLFAFNSCIKADNPDENLLYVLEQKSKIVKSEIKTLKLKLKLDKNDQETITAIENKNNELKELEQSMKIVDETIDVQKETNELLKEYQNSYSKLETLRKQVEYIDKKFNTTK